MDELEIKWRALTAKIADNFAGPMDVSSLLFLIGVQELGKGFCKFSKDEKIDLMHIAVCTLFEKSGYYKFLKRDKEGWPHWKRLKKIPVLSTKDQKDWMKKAILEYFESKSLEEFF